MAKFSFREVAPCLFAIFIDILGFGLVAPLIIALFTSPDHNIFNIASSTLRYFCLGLTLALYPLLMFFGTSFIGDLSDIIGRKKTLAFSMIGMAFGFFMMGISIITSSLFLFLFGRALSGFVAASQSVALATISDLSTQENKAIHLSYIALIQCIGFVVGPLLGGGLSGVDFFTPFLLASFLACIAFLWILFFFEETFNKRCHKTISLSRFFRVFIEAYQNPRIRKLSFIFLTMQIGVGLYLPILWILLTTQFGFSPLFLGLFNGYMGIGFALGLISILPWMLKHFKIERIVFLCLLITCITQLFSSVFSSQMFLWFFAFLYAIAIEVAFSGMFTSFSNAADEKSQGWVMGISVAIMAIAWAIAGFSAQLAPHLGERPLMFIGGLFLAFSTLLMKQYYTRHLK